MVMPIIQGTITSLKAAGDIINGMLELKTLSEVQGKIIDLQRAILDAQSSALSANADQSEMVEEISALKKEISDIKAWETQKKRYKLVAPWDGALVYALKETMSKSEPPHWICTKCYEDGRKSILNPEQNERRRYVFICPVCGAKAQSPYTSAMKQEYVSE